jgi:uncharacterized membrane protein
MVATVPEIQSSATVAAPPEAVFDFIDHWPNAMRYLKRMVRWEPVDPNNTGVGGVFHVGVQAGPTRLNGRLEVTEHDRPNKIAFRSLDGPRVDGSWTITPAEGGSRVVLESYYEPPGGLIGRVVASFIRQNAQNDLDSSLRELKRLIEAGS